MIFTRVLELPYSVKGFVTEDEDGNYNIYINSRYAYGQNLKTLAHELQHIKQGDLDSDRLAIDIEKDMAV